MAKTIVAEPLIPLTPLRDVVARHGLAATKALGQNFLFDLNLTSRIARSAGPLEGQTVVEIGPGLMALSQPLVERLGKLTVIELDRDLAVRLRLRPELDVVESDVLKVDFRAIAQRLGVPKLRVVGNLPYNISSPILFHLLEQVDVVQDQHFMLQKEVIDRMVAQPATSDYGRLTVMLQWRYAMENVLFVPPESFDPPPKVDSAVVRMVPREQPASLNPKLLEELVQVAFSQRRKILRNTLGKWLDEKGFAGNFDLQRRAEEVPVAEYEALAASFS